MQKSTFQVVIQQEDDQHRVQILQVTGVDAKKRPITNAVYDRTFGDEAAALAQYEKIVAHPYPATEKKSISRDELASSQELVECPGKTTGSGEPKQYRVPGRLKTFTRRGYTVVLDPTTDGDGRIANCAAHLMKADTGDIINTGYGVGPWAALEVLSVLTEKWHVYQKSGQIRVGEIRTIDVPKGALLEGTEANPVTPPNVVEGTVRPKKKAEKKAEKKAKNPAEKPAEKPAENPAEAAPEPSAE